MTHGPESAAELPGPWRRSRAAPARESCQAKGRSSRRAVLESRPAANWQIHPARSRPDRCRGRPLVPFAIWVSRAGSDWQRMYEPILYGWREGTDHFGCGARD